MNQGSFLAVPVRRALLFRGYDRALIALNFYMVVTFDVSLKFSLTDIIEDVFKTAGGSPCNAVLVILGVGFQSRRLARDHAGLGCSEL